MKGILINAKVTEEVSFENGDSHSRNETKFSNDSLSKSPLPKTNQDEEIIMKSG
jgi:hypothetical protein